MKKLNPKILYTTYILGGLVLGLSMMIFFTGFLKILGLVLALGAVYKFEQFRNRKLFAKGVELFHGIGAFFLGVCLIMAYVFPELQTLFSIVQLLSAIMIWTAIFFNKPLLTLQKKIFRDIYTKEEFENLKSEQDKDEILKHFK